MTQNIYTECQSKKAYSKKMAQTLVNARNKNTKNKVRIYQCDFCNYWHMSKATWIVKKTRNAVILGKKARLKHRYSEEDF